MKARDSVRASALRMLLSSIRNTEIEKHSALTDDEVIGQVQKAVRVRREAIEGYAKGGRAEMKAKEEAELKALESYLPAALSEGELGSLVDSAIAECGAKVPGDMGKVMKAVMPRVAGRADGARISECVRQKLKPAA